MGRIIPYIMEKKNAWNHQPDFACLEHLGENQWKTRLSPG